VTVGNGGEAGLEHDAVVVFDIIVPPFIEALKVSPDDDVIAVGTIVSVAVPELSVKTVPLRPESGPVTANATPVAATGFPFDKTTAVSVMVAPAPQMTEEVAGESPTVAAPEHPLMMASLLLIVTEPFLASARPLRVPPFSVILVNAIIVPAKVLPVCMVAEEPTCQNTLQGEAPPAKATVAPVAVVRVLPIWKIHTSVEVPVSVRVPFSSAAEE